MTTDATAEVTPEPITELLARARGLGIRAKVTSGTKVHFRAPPTAEALNLVAELRQRNAEVLAILLREAERLDTVNRLLAAAQKIPQREYHRPPRRPAPQQPSRTPPLPGFGFRKMRRGR